METKTVKVGQIEFHLRYPKSHPQPKPTEIKIVKEELDEVEQEEERERKRKAEEVHPEEVAKPTCL